MTSSPRYYLGILPHLLNPVDLDYEWFGVLWLEAENSLSYYCWVLVY